MKIALVSYYFALFFLIAGSSSSTFALQMDEQTSQQQCESSDGEWPNLFVEACEMTIASMFVFAIADLRSLARNGKLTAEDTEEVLHHLPMRGDKLKAMWERNESRLQGVRSSDFGTVVDPYAAEVRHEHWKAIQIHHVGDEKSEEECVYVIVTDSIDKSITLSFRGSITIKDWIQNAQTVFGSIPNPVASLAPDQPDTLGVHLGFRDYLYGESPSILSSLLDLSEEVTDKEQTEEKKPKKIDVILDQLRLLHEKYPDFRLYITGHSLGGALALLGALEVASILGGDPHPVTCVALGNPMVGNHAFRSAINLLEEQKKLRCIGIHNFLDIVPSIPDHVVTGEDNFCHVGMKMDLFKDHFELLYTGRQSVTKTVWRRIAYSFRRFVRGIPIHVRSWRFKDRLILHNYREYFERLMAQKDKLSKLYLNDLYDKEKQGSDGVCSK